MSARKSRPPSNLPERALFLLKVMPVLAAVLGVGAYLGDRFHLGIDDQKELS
jgi:hypothetical protein